MIRFLNPVRVYAIASVARAHGLTFPNFCAIERRILASPTSAGEMTP